MNLLGLSHVMLCATNLEESRSFYVDVLGFELLEADPDHGGVFLGLPGTSHVIDLAPVDAPRPPAPALDPDHKPRPGMGHLALHVGSPDELRDAYFELTDAGVTILGSADHKSQQSIYFLDPDNNVLEICWERPDARDLYLSGRADQDSALTFVRT